MKLADYFGKKPIVLSLVYYDCPMLCTLGLNGLSASPHGTAPGIETSFAAAIPAFAQDSFSALLLQMILS